MRWLCEKGMKQIKKIKLKCRTKRASGCFLNLPHMNPSFCSLHFSSAQPWKQPCLFKSHTNSAFLQRPFVQRLWKLQLIFMKLFINIQWHKAHSLGEFFMLYFYHKYICVMLLLLVTGRINYVLKINYTTSTFTSTSTLNVAPAHKCAKKKKKSGKHKMSHGRWLPLSDHTAKLMWIKTVSRAVDFHR